MCKSKVLKHKEAAQSKLKTMCLWKTGQYGAIDQSVSDYELPEDKKGLALSKKEREEDPFVHQQ